MFGRLKEREGETGGKEGPQGSAERFLDHSPQTVVLWKGQVKTLLVGGFPVFCAVLTH